MNLRRDWYFLQVGPLDPRAQKFPLPDELMGRLLEFVIKRTWSGRALGFQPQHEGELDVPSRKVHEPGWVEKIRARPSIMDYAPVQLCRAAGRITSPLGVWRRGIRPYDVWATVWGYKPDALRRKPRMRRKPRWMP